MAVNPIRPTGKPPASTLVHTPIYESAPKMEIGDMTRPWVHFFFEVASSLKKIDILTNNLDADIGKIIVVSRARYMR